MIDETQAAGDPTDGVTEASASEERAVGYCQECGRPLTTSSLQRIGDGVFCRPCANRAAASAVGQNWQPVSPSAAAGAAPGRSADPVSGAEPVAGGGFTPPPPGDANPTLAAALGFIPGVGAMYNGQYAKGALHLIIFVVLVILSDNVNDTFGWLVAGWIFYQVFEAYHTARARRDHLPPPNPFGWNDLDERLGFTRTSSPNQRSGPAAAQAATGANWFGYVAPPPPAAPVPVASASPSDNPYLDPISPPQESGGAFRSAGTGQAAYAPTYTGQVSGAPTMNPQTPYAAPQRFPTGALALIAFGLLFLLGNVLPNWRLSGRWLVPSLLAVAAVWSGARRIQLFHAGNSVFSRSRSLICVLVGPVVLLTLAVLLGLQAAEVFPLRRSWPVLLVIWGVMLLAQRAAENGPSSPLDPINSPESAARGSAGPLGL